MKKAVSSAIDNGHGFVAWTTGSQQANFYDLSKSIRRVEWLPDKKTLVAYDFDGQSVIDQVTEENKIEDYVGKDVAKKLLESEPRITGSGKKIHSVEGDGLKIEAPWTAALYGDESGNNAQGQPAMLTQAARELAKKFGGRVGSVDLDSGKQPALFITPQMRDKILDEGIPLFSKAQSKEHQEYDEGVKYHQKIPEVTLINVNKLQRMNSNEVSDVSDDIAAKMDFSESIDVSVFASGEMRIVDGHHRVASAKKRGIQYLPVNLQAINARGEKINELIDESNNAQESNNIRFSIADDVKSFLTDRDKPIKTLSDLDNAMQSGKMPKSSLDWQSIKDNVAKIMVDSTRPVTVWLRKIPNAQSAGQVQLALDRTKTRSRAMEQVAKEKYLDPLSEEIAAIAKEKGWDYALTKDVMGYWMTARYAVEKNADYIRQDQQAVDDAQTELNADPTNPALKSALTRAQNKQTKRLDAINEQRHIDPTEESLNAGLAGGYNNFTAKEQMKKYEAAIPKARLESAAKHVYDMLEWKKQQDIANGKVTQAMVNTWQNSPYYVPLTGDPTVDEGEDELFQHGNINQSKDKKAIGRAGSLAQNGIDASVEQVQKSARYHGWVDFKENFTAMVDQLIGDNIAAGMTQKEAEKAVFDDYRISRKPERAMMPLTDTQFIIRKNGINTVVDVHNSDVINALKSTNKEDSPSFLAPIAGFTRAYAYAVTQLMPGFSQINAIRDTWERTENIRTKTFPGYETIDMDSVARKAINAAIDPRLPLKIASVLSDNKVKWDQADPDIALIKEMIAEGGASSIGYYLAGNNLDLAKQLEKSTKIPAKAAKLISTYNNSFELISSYSIYKSLKEHGVDKKTAASGTLNLMNFTKSGTAIGPMRALYAFINPTMQGGHQMIQLLSTPKGQARAGAYLLAGVLVYSLMRAIDGDDDELGKNKLDNQSSFILERNIMIPIGDGTYFKLPVGFGMPQAMWSTAVNLVKGTAGDQSAVDSMAEIIKSFSRTLAPVQPSETSISKHPIFWGLQTMTPQALKPIVNIGIDRSMFGQPLTNQRFSKPDVALALQGRKSTPVFYKDMAKALSNMGIDMYPEQVREVWRGYMVGPANEITKAFIENPNKEAQGRRSVNSLVDRYIAVHDTGALKERLYYRYREEMNDAAAKLSLGKDLSDKEKKLVTLNTLVKKMEGRANGKLSAATKAEKRIGGVSHYRKEAEKIRTDTMTLTINKMKHIDD